MKQPYYEDDYITLYHGDCLELTEWAEADVLVTDPPYGVEWVSGFTSYRKTTDKVISTQEAIKNDESTLVRDTALELWGDKPAVVFGSWKQPRPALTKHRLIWHKAGMPPGPTNSSFMSQDEEIYILGNGFVKSSPPMRSVITTKEHRSIEVAKVGHPTPKPVGLMELLIARCPDGVIADPFAGSGATLVAARNLGRKAIGVEFEEKYCEIIATRLANQTFDFSLLEV
jgi:site-specific DNA-methyltransferase (adenine-specific)